MKLKNLKFNSSKKLLLSNVTGEKMNETSEIKELLIKQIESRVRWRESIKYMIENGTESLLKLDLEKYYQVL